MKCFCGAEMSKFGYGKFPYGCRAKDLHPFAMVYQGCAAGHTCWTHDPDDVQPGKRGIYGVSAHARKVPNGYSPYLTVHAPKPYRIPFDLVCVHRADAVEYAERERETMYLQAQGG